MRDTEVNFSSSIVTCVATTCQTLEVIKKRRELKMLPFFLCVNLLSWVCACFK